MDELGSQHLLTLFKLRTYVVMRGGSISFFLHRRCNIYFLLIHSDIFLCVQRSEYSDFSGKPSTTRPFCSKIEVAGRDLHKILAKNTTRRETQVWRFSRQTFRRRPWESHKPRTTFADKKGTASVFIASHIVVSWKGSESATLEGEIDGRRSGNLDTKRLTK